jgi:putative protease
MIDLLSPVGDFDCLKAAVQNGANSVYFGANLFSARAFASNFDLDELKNAIQYARIRGVKTNLTLNTLIKNDEFEDAFNLAKKAYEFGIDAIIVQDLGLAKMLIKSFPDLAIHASTQMSVHNLQGVLELQELGFKRVVLSRELSIGEIEYICRNSNVEIECFIHGALCISYSGQCLFSSMIGGRSGNRGKCAQPCRLPYKLLENNSVIDSGYLLSTRDICGLDFIPDMINAGVTCLKIEGRMKKPEYVATVTRIYRKYIDLAESSEPYVVDDADRKILMQAFNRGSFSCGHLSNEPNKKLVFKDKSDNMGLFLGKVEKYNSNKGYITVKLNEPIEVGDTVALERESGTYNVSEVMVSNKNIKGTKVGQTVTIGRMKGNIKLGDKIFKMSSKSQNSIANDSLRFENRKVALNCKVTVKENQPLEINITSANDLDIYKNLNITSTLDVLPVEAKNRPISKDDIIAQINKTNSTPFNFANIKVNLDDNLFLPKISSLNELRRTALENVENFAISNIQRISDGINYNACNENSKNANNSNSDENKISVLLNILNEKYDYSSLEGIDIVYIPLKYFVNKKYSNILETLSKKFELYIYLPTIIKANYRNLLSLNIENAIKSYNIKGFVLSNISNLLLLDNVLENCSLNKNDFNFIANYTFNIFNNHSVKELKELGFNRFTISPELNKETILDLTSSNTEVLASELIVYGKTPLMNMNYCLLGKANKCYPNCDAKCNSCNKYYLKDRLGLNFEIIPDNIQTVTTIYNSKTTSIESTDFVSTNVFRIDVIDESIDDINNIVSVVNSGNRFEGKEFTNGNLNREV